MTGFAKLAVTVLSFAAFIGIALWAYSAGRRDAFEEASLMPLREEEFDKELQ